MADLPLSRRRKRTGDDVGATVYMVARADGTKQICSWPDARLTASGDTWDVAWAAFVAVCEKAERAATRRHHVGGTQ